MAPFAAIVAVRTGGVIRGGIAPSTRQSLAACAKSFGLRATEDAYISISHKRALDILANVIHRDLAHGYEFTTRSHALSLASAFLAEVASAETVYFTNGTPGWTEEPPSPGRTWTPATDATLDTGVLAVHPTKLACLWVEDED